MFVRPSVRSTVRLFGPSYEVINFAVKLTEGATRYATHDVAKTRCEKKPLKVVRKIFIIKIVFKIYDSRFEKMKKLKKKNLKMKTLYHGDSRTRL